MLSADAALQIMLDSISVLDAEETALRDCLGRILARDVRADIDLPPFDNSAMDGYAVIAEDTAGSSKDDPRRLKVIAEQPAGRVTRQTVTSGTAVRIMTGAPMPSGADSVVVVENTFSEGDEVVIYGEVSSGANVRYGGEDVKRGAVALRKGMLVGPAHMGMLAALGNTMVTVSQRPRIAIVTTGDEAVEPSVRPGPGQIRNSNQYSLLGDVLQVGAEVSSVEHVGDSKEQTEQALAKAAAASDLIIVCGGVSVGAYDRVKDVIAKLGEIIFWRVAIKPGKPLVFGRIGDRLVFGLPGNPVSCMVTFDLFVRPAVLRMMGAAFAAQNMVSGIVTDDIQRRPGPREFIRAVTAWQDGGYLARPIPKHGSGMLSSMVEANSYIVVPEEIAEISRGGRVDIILRPCSGSLSGDGSCG